MNNDSNTENVPLEDQVVQESDDDDKSIVLQESSTNPNNPDKLLMERLQKLNITNLELQSEKDQLENRVCALEKVQSELKCKLDRSQQQIDSVKKELQSMVMKYATSEREVLNLRKHLTDSDKKFKDSVREREQLQNRIKDLSNEKKQLISTVERHVLEAASLKNELDLTRTRLEQSCVRDEKAQLELQNLTLDYKALKSKIEMIESSIAKVPRISVNSTKYSLDEDDEDYDNKNDVTTTTLETDSISSEQHCLAHNEPADTDYTAVFQQVLQTNERLLKEKNFYHQQNSELESRIEELGNRLAEASARSDDYGRKLALIDELKKELIKKQHVVDSLKEKFDQINSINRSLVGDIDSSKSKESELLDYTERLTAKLVSLQSGSNELETKLKECQQNLDTLQANHQSLMATKRELEAELDSCRQEYTSQAQSSARQLEAVTAENLSLRRRVEELENDIAIAKKKHCSALKEMSAELQKLKRPQGQAQNHTDLVTSSSLSSRTGSVSSLNNETNNVVLESYTEPTPNHSNKLPSPQSLLSSEPESVSSTAIRQPESEMLPTCDNQEIITSLSQVKKSVLIEKLLKLQRILVKRKEKIDFLEEHSEQLTEQIRNKTKLLQHYILKEETGTLATDSMDQNKAYLSKRGGGIMSSLYNTFSTDDSMTLERSLEINAKLHALLEDTLLKNMTLKENLNTLASEIDKLSSK